MNNSSNNGDCKLSELLALWQIERLENNVIDKKSQLWHRRSRFSGVMFMLLGLKGVGKGLLG